MQGKIQCYGYGSREDIPNPGDLMIVSTGDLAEGINREAVEFILTIRGRDIHLFADAASTALQLWNDNKHWLTASMSQPGVDTRPMTQIRSADQAAAVKGFYDRNR
jgi:hypothetical protein